MNQDQVEGKWKRMKGKLKAEWNELTDDEIEAAEGRSEQLAGKIQERYGISKEAAKERIKELEAS